MKFSPAKIVLCVNIILNSRISKVRKDRRDEGRPENNVCLFICFCHSRRPLAASPLSQKLASMEEHLVSNLLKLIEDLNRYKFTRATANIICYSLLVLRNSVIMIVSQSYQLTNVF